MPGQRTIELLKKWGWILWAIGFVAFLPSEMKELGRAVWVIRSSQLSNWLTIAGLALLVLASILEYRKTDAETDRIVRKLAGP